MGCNVAEKVSKEAARVVREAEKSGWTLDRVVNQPEIKELTRASMSPTIEEATRINDTDGRDKQIKGKRREMRGVDKMEIDKCITNHNAPARQ